MATVNTLAGDLYSMRERARIQGYLSSVWGMAAIIGPTLGGVFAEYVSWRWIFVVNLPIGAAAITLLIVYLHESGQHERQRIDNAGAGAILLAVGTLIFAVLQGGTAWPWLSTPSLLVFAGAAVLLVVAVWVERRAAAPIMPGWIWRHRSLTGANLAMVGMGFAVMAPDAYLPTYAQSVFGLGAVTAGLVLASMSIGWPTASALAGRLYLRIGFRNTALIGSVLVCIAGAVFLLLPYDVPVWVVVVDQVLIGAGFGLLSTSMLVGAQSSVGWRNRGVVTGANMFSRYLGQSFGVAVFGVIFNATLLERLHGAPAGLKQHLPQTVDAIMPALHGPHLPHPVETYLRHAINAATHHLYIGLLVVAVLTVCAVLVVPKVFEKVSNTGAHDDDGVGGSAAGDGQR